MPDNYTYSERGYLWYVLPIKDFIKLPETVEIDGIKLTRKKEFHATVINGRNIATDIADGNLNKIPEIEEDLQKILTEYVARSPITLTGFENDLRLAITSDRTSIVARCTMRNLEGYFSQINKKYGKTYPVQPAHVSIYTADGLAVGIDSTEKMESFKKIELPEVQEMLNIFYLS